jgi:hypothetical protein
MAWVCSVAASAQAAGNAEPRINFFPIINRNITIIN